MGLGCMDVFSMGTDAVKGDSDMRITKEPEVRRQEILDTALRLFGEQGYEKTSITDIARAIGVAQAYAIVTFHQKKHCLTVPLSSMQISWWSRLQVYR